MEPRHEALVQQALDMIAHRELVGDDAAVAEALANRLMYPPTPAESEPDFYAQTLRRRLESPNRMTHVTVAS
jgi:hypothetical protein